MEVSPDTKPLIDQVQVALCKFTEHLDTNVLLEDIRIAATQWTEQLAASAVQQQLQNQDFLKSLKIIAARSGLRFHGYKSTSIQLLSGNRITIVSPGSQHAFTIVDVLY
jgi:hypothetical protein